MNDEQIPPENEEIDDTSAPDEIEADEVVETLDSVSSFSNADEFVANDDFDINAALAAVGSLGGAIDDEMLATMERAEAAELRADEEERAEAARIEREARAERQRRETIQRPPMVKIRTGQLATIVPALVLMASGAYMTFALSVEDLPLTAGILGLIVLGGSGISLLAYWLSTGRWSRGAFLLGASLLSTGLGMLYLEQSATLNVANFPMIGVIFGAVIVLSGLLCRPSEGRYTALGAGVVIGSGAYLLLTTGTLSADTLNLMEQAAPFVLIAIVVLMALGVVFNRPDSTLEQVTESQ